MRTVVVVLVATGCSQSSPYQPRTSVAVAVDLSASFAPLTKDDRHALESLITVLERLSSESWEQPVRLYWLAIGTASATKAEPCGPAVYYAETLVDRSGSKDTLTRKRHLRAWANACLLRLFGADTVVDSSTDISGALQAAADSARHIDGAKILIVLSDLIEESGSPSIPLKLSGEKIVLLYRPTGRDLIDPARVSRRLADWEARLRSAGASQICHLAVKGVGPDSIERCLSKR